MANFKVIYRCPVQHQHQPYHTEGDGLLLPCVLATIREGLRNAGANEDDVLAISVTRSDWRGLGRAILRAAGVNSYDQPIDEAEAFALRSEKR